MLKKVLEIDQNVLGLFQYVSNLFFWKFSKSNLQLIVYCYAVANVFIAIELILQDKIFTKGLSNDWLIKVKVAVFIALVVVCMVITTVIKKRDRKWQEKVGYINTKRYNMVVLILRISCLGIGSLTMVFSNLNIVAGYIGIFFLTNACAFYFLSCEPGNTDFLRQQDGLIA
jgi:amino acid transporter